MGLSMLLYEIEGVMVLERMPFSALGPLKLVYCKDSKSSVDAALKDLMLVRVKP